jgi:hypothetical protein
MKHLAIFLIITIFSGNIVGQKRWMVALSGSADKVTPNINSIIPVNKNSNYFDKYSMYYGYSINLNLQREFNKHWFIRSGVDYFSYSFQFTPNYLSNLNSNSISSSQLSVKYNLGLFEIPIYVGFQTQVAKSDLRFYVTWGGAFGTYLNQNDINNLKPYGSGFSNYTFNYVLTTGLSYPLTPDLLIFGGANLRSGLNVAQFGSVGLQLGTMYYFGKSSEYKKANK